MLFNKYNVLPIKPKMNKMKNKTTVLQEKKHLSGTSHQFEYETNERGSLQCVSRSKIDH